MDAPFGRAVPQVLASERGLPVLLGLMVLAGFVLPTLGLEGSDERLYADITFSLVLVSGVAAASTDRRTGLLVASVALVTLVVKWASWLPNTPRLNAWREPTTLATELLIGLAILRRVLSAGRVTSFRVQGAIVAYLLFGLSWANAYHIVALHHPGAFASQGALPMTVNDWVYFSFITLTTVGYGDLVPVHRTARVLAAGEALTGQLYIAVLLARLVSLEITTRTTRTESGTMDPSDDRAKRGQAA